jgi:hypothetical protein
MPNLSWTGFAVDGVRTKELRGALNAARTVVAVVTVVTAAEAAAAVAVPAALIYTELFCRNVAERAQPPIVHAATPARTFYRQPRILHCFLEETADPLNCCNIKFVIIVTSLTEASTPGPGDLGLRIEIKRSRGAVELYVNDQFSSLEILRPFSSLRRAFQGQLETFELQTFYT